MGTKNNIENFDKNYGKIMGMNNAGYTAREIAVALSLPVWRVVDTIQVAYGRSLKYGRRYGAR